MPDYGPYKRPQEIRFEDIPWGSIKKIYTAHINYYLCHYYRIYCLLYGKSQ